MSTLLGVIAGVIMSMIIQKLEIRKMVKQLNKNYALHESIEGLKRQEMYNDQIGN